jgi:hypothetical protein
MKQKHFPEEQITGILKEAEAGAVVTDLCRRGGSQEHAVSLEPGRSWRPSVASARAGAVTPTVRLSAVAHPDRFIVDPIHQMPGLNT